MINQLVKLYNAVTFQMLLCVITCDEKIEGHVPWF